MDSEKMLEKIEKSVIFSAVFLPKCEKVLFQEV